MARWAAPLPRDTGMGLGSEVRVERGFGFLGLEMMAESCCLLSVDGKEIQGNLGEVLSDTMGSFIFWEARINLQNLLRKIASSLWD